MASIYKRPDSGLYWLSCYPKQGGALMRVGLGTGDRSQAEAIQKKVELLVGIERLGGVPIPPSLLSHFGSVSAPPVEGEATERTNGHKKKTTVSPPKNELREAMRQDTEISLLF